VLTCAVTLDSARIASATPPTRLDPFRIFFIFCASLGLPRLLYYIYLRRALCLLDHREILISIAFTTSLPSSLLLPRRPTSLRPVARLLSVPPIPRLDRRTNSFPLSTSQILTLHPLENVNVNETSIMAVRAQFENSNESAANIPVLETSTQTNLILESVSFHA
jgi:hypothetical protein